MAISFEIYRDGSRLTQYVPVAPMAMGPESVPIPGDVQFRDGLLTLGKNEDHAAGISLLWDAGAIGAYHLETTRLPHREAPYVLNVELARARLMKIVQKQEDWNLFDFPKAEKFNQRFREAQGMLAEAFGLLGSPVEASVIADKALTVGIELSEELAMFHAELLLNRRRNTNALPRHVIGCKIDPTIQSQKYKDTITEKFDFVVLPMSWKLLQPEEGVFNTQPIDDWVELLSRKRIPIVAGPLIDLGDNAVPDWMFIWEHDFDTLRELAYEYVTKVVSRYKRAVAAWDVVSGLHTNKAFTLNFEQIIELTRLLVSQVKTVVNGARVLVSVTEPFGEIQSRGATSVPPMLYAEMVAQSGVNVDAFSVHLQTGVPTPGTYTRDLFQISCLLDRFASLGRPLYLTSVSAPGRNTPDSSDQSQGRLNPSTAGRWRKPWDAAVQSQWVDDVYRLALSKPYVEGIAWADVADLTPSIPAGGLLDDMFKPKPAFNKIQELRELFQRHGKR